MSDEIQLEAREWQSRRARRKTGRTPRAQYGGESNSSSRNKAHDYVPKEYRKQRGFVASELQNQINGRVPGLEGPFVASLAPDEQSALAQFKANAFDPGGVGSAADAQLRSTLATNPKDNPFLQGAITAATRPILQDAQLQELRDRAQFTGTGQKIQGSTAFQENRNNAIRDTENRVTDAAAQLAFAERSNQLQAVSLANSRLSEQREGIQALALPRLIEQLGIDKGNAELQRRFKVMEDALQTLAQLTQPSLGGQGYSWSQSTQGGMSGGGGGSGGGSGGVAGVGG